jgi:hypothetical protein
MLELLTWIAERPRTYSETIDAWKSSCPRLAVWEDALTDGLVHVKRGRVSLTGAGAESLTHQPDESSSGEAENVVTSDSASAT